MNIQDKIAIVTGSSKGIGLETCKMLLEQGVKVAGWSRSATNISHPNFVNILTDVQTFEAVEKAYNETKSHFGGEIAILVNNAGLGWDGYLENFDIEKWKIMFATNVDALFYTSKLVLPNMRASREGHIVNISSIAGLEGFPTMTGYCATKHAVRGLSHALYKEVRDYGVKITCIYPGSVKTNFFDEINGVEINDNMMRPQDIAETIVHALKTHPNFHQVDIEVRPLMPKGMK